MVSALFPLHVRGAASWRKRKRLIGPIDLDLAGTGTCVVLGPNGSGKTTLLRLLHGIERLSEGKITWACDQNTARNAQAFVFQRPILLRRSVLDNIAYPLVMRGTSWADARHHAEIWAQRLGLSDFPNRQATVLSGGEQQKLALARALICKPQLLFLDEPTASLDGRAIRDIEAVLQDIQHGGTQLIMSTHDMGQARRLASHVVFMLHGSVHETGPAPVFFAGPKTHQARAFLQGDIVE
jgi:tungstate transport system ATP-binding protein